MISLSPQFLEATNGTLLVIFVALALMFARYIWTAICAMGWRAGYRNRRAAIAMMILIGGEAIIRGHVWAWRHFSIAADNKALTIGTTIGVIVCIVGGTCALRYFAPDSWGRAPWVLIPLIGLAFGIGMAL